MKCRAQCFVVVLLCSIYTSYAQGQDQQEERRPGIELRLVESNPIEGVTEEKGFPMGEDPDNIVYAHKKPSIVLDSGLAEVQVKELELDGGSGPMTYYMVILELTDEARRKLADAIDGTEMRLLTAVVDGKYRGIQRYEKDNDKLSAPKTARAESFSYNLGMFLSEDEVAKVRAQMD